MKKMLKPYPKKLLTNNKRVCSKFVFPAAAEGKNLKFAIESGRFAFTSNVNGGSFLLKLFVTILFFYVLSTSLMAQDTIFVYYDEDWKELPQKEGAAFYRKAFMDNNRTYIAKDYYISGHIQMIGRYKSKRLKKKHGHFTYFYENGQKSSEGSFSYDREQGLWTYWYENGMKKSELQFKEGFLDQICTYWSKTGNISMKQHYMNKLLHSVESYHDNGQLSLKVDFNVQGKMKSSTFWNSEGRKILEGNYRNGQKHGTWKRYFKDGEMVLKYNRGYLQNQELGGIVRD